jgi:hypothetical protein
LATRFAGLPDVHYGNDEHFVDSAADTGISKWTLTGTTREGVRRFDLRYSAASLALLLFLGLPSAFFSTGARNFPV